MKALTVWQPWASLIMIGAKPWEFRSWRTPAWLIGQRLVIHAGARPVKWREVIDLIQRLEGGEAWSTCLHKEKALPHLLDSLSTTARPLPLSAGLGTVLVGEPRGGWDIAAEFGHPGEVNDSDREGTANWGWPMEDVQPFDEPVPCKGAQGLWDWRGGALEQFAQNI